MITALLYKDATARILQVACVLAVCWVVLVYTVAALPISLDTSGTNPLNATSSVVLASQATVIVAAVLANIELGSEESTMAAIIVGSRYRMAVALVSSKTIIILAATLLLTLVDAVSDARVYGSGGGINLVFRYTALAAMNGLAVLSLALTAGNVLLGLAVYSLTPILLKPFIISAAPMTQDLFYSTTIRLMSDGNVQLTSAVPVLLGWLLVFLGMEYAALVRRRVSRIVQA